MIHPDILAIETQSCMKFINTIFSKYCSERLPWEERYDQHDKITQLVSTLMTKEQANLLKDKLVDLLPTTVSVVKSRQAESECCYRVMINIKKCQEYLNEGAYINFFLSNIRTFPSTFWLNIGEDRIKACYPVESIEHYNLLIRALKEFNSGLNYECFDYSINENGELVVIGNINEIKKVIAHHKTICLSILQEFFRDINGISNVTMYANVASFSSYHAYLVVNNSNERGLPGLTLQVKDTKTYEQVHTCFPDFIQIKPNGYVSIGKDENNNREIGIKLTYLTDMSYLIAHQLHQNIHNARSDFCEQLWTLKTKGSFFNSTLRFFPQDITRYIYKDICPDNAYLTHEEITDTLLKIEKGMLSDELETTKKSNGLN